MLEIGVLLLRVCLRQPAVGFGVEILRALQGGGHAGQIGRDLPGIGAVGAAAKGELCAGKGGSALGQAGVLRLLRVEKALRAQEVVVAEADGGNGLEGVGDRLLRVAHRGEGRCAAGKLGIWSAVKPL